MSNQKPIQFSPQNPNVNCEEFSMSLCNAGHCVSRHHISIPCNLLPHQQRCVYKISNQKYHRQIFLTPRRFPIAYILNRIVPPYLTFVVITTYNHRCDYKISLQKYHQQIFFTPKKSLIVWLCNRIRSVTAYVVT